MPLGRRHQHSRSPALTSRRACHVTGARGRGRDASALEPNCGRGVRSPRLGRDPSHATGRAPPGRRKPADGDVNLNLDSHSLSARPFIRVAIAHLNGTRESAALAPHEMAEQRANRRPNSSSRSRCIRFISARTRRARGHSAPANRSDNWTFGARAPPPLTRHKSGCCSRATPTGARIGGRRANWARAETRRRGARARGRAPNERTSEQRRSTLPLGWSVASRARVSAPSSPRARARTRGWA